MKPFRKGERPLKASFSISLQPETVVRIDAFAALLGTTRSQLINRLCEEYLADHTEEVKDDTI